MMTLRHPYLIGVLLLSFAPLLAQTAGASSEPSSQGTRFIFRMWPDYLLKFDPRTDEVVGKVKNKNGIAHSTVLTHDKQRILQVTGQKSVIEVVDVESFEVVDEHSFKRDGYIIRISTVKECPGGSRWYVKVDRIKKELDHFVIEKPEWLLYDVEQEKILKHMKELPKPIRSGARISPDGKKWHVFGKDITIVDPKTLKEEGRIELSRPLHTGMGPIQVTGGDFFDGKNPKAYRMFYTMRDPVITNRSLFGVVDIDIEKKRITHLREIGWQPRVGRWILTRDKKTAFGQSWGRGRRSEGGDPEITLVTFNVEKGRKVLESRVKVRNGLYLGAVSPDGEKLYLMGRGHELVVHGRDHRYLKTIELPGEVDGRILVVEE